MFRKCSQKSLENTKSIPVEYLREAFEYDAKAGVLRWKERPINHFPTELAMKKVNPRWAGKVVGDLRKGYRVVGITYNGRFMSCKVHHVVWKLMGREFEAGKVIDHKNGNRDDNRIRNLRSVTPSQNNQNKKLQSNNRTGVAGVQKTVCGTYLARITVNRKGICLGTYSDINDAVAARKEAERVYFGEHSYDASRETDSPVSELPKPEEPPFELTPEDEKWLNSIGSL